VIDRGNDQPWPEAVAGKLAAYRQGSLVVSPPFAYHASTLHPIWAASRLIQPGPNPLELIELDPDNRPPFGIVTTQSCDIDEEGRNKKPWVQVAPVYEIPADDPNLGNVRAWKTHHLAPVIGLGPTWVADLRIELPIEKSWLVLQPPRDGFTTAEEFQKFGDHCGRYRSRQGVGTSIYDLLLTPLEDHLRSLRSSHPQLSAAFTDDVEHLYLAIAGDHLAPRAVQLIFVSPAPLAAELIAQLDTWWESAFGGIQTTPFSVLSNRYLSFDEIRFTELRTWVEQDLARLNASS